MQEDLQEIKFFLAECSLKEAKKKSSTEEDLFVVDIGKIIKDLGYDTGSLSKESEFVINYSVQKKITQGIYSTKCDSILVCYRNMPSNFKDNLEEFLGEFSETVDYSIHNL